MKNLCSAALLLCVFVALPIVGRANPITVFGTGVDSSGNALAGGSADPHFTDNLYDASAVVISPSNLYPSWTANTSPGDPGSAWIGTADEIRGQSPGGNPYDFVETFSMAGLDTTTASITGTYWGDDVGYWELNGNIFGSADEDWGGTAFTIDGSSDYFNAGTNTLEFVMTSTNLDNYYDGTRLDITSATADPSGVPDASSAAVLLSFGLAGLAASRRRFARAV